MKYLFSSEGLADLQQFVNPRTLLAFDFDGTLARIVPDRTASRLTSKTEELFSRCSVLYPCTVISGRARADVAGRLGTARLVEVVGNHGMEPWTPDAQVIQQMQEISKALHFWLEDTPGVEIEDKISTLSVHYRGAANTARARRGIVNAIHPWLHVCRVVPGKCVINLIPIQGSNKGTALQKLVNSTGHESALYVGDDATDEDVFQLETPFRIFKIRVGRSLQTRADYYLRSQREMDRLLRVLLQLQETPQVHPAIPHLES